MNIFVVKYLYNVSREHRKPIMLEHKARLKALKEEGKLLCAGRGDTDKVGLIIYLLSSREELDDILISEPYFINNFIESASITSANLTI